MMEEVNLRFPILFNLSHIPINMAAACPVWVSNFYGLGAVHTTHYFFDIGYLNRAHTYIIPIYIPYTYFPLHVATRLRLTNLSMDRAHIKVKKQNKHVV